MHGGTHNQSTADHSSADAPRPRAEAPRKAPVVLQVLPALETGGVERGAVDIAAAIAEAGWTPLVASSGGRLEHELTRIGATHFTLPLKSKNPLVMARNVRRLGDLIAREGVDLVHARSRAPAWSAFLAARQAGVPFVTTFHGTHTHGTWAKRRYNAVMTYGRRVIAISEFIADHLRKVYNVDDARIRVIHRGIDTARFHPAAVSADRIIGLARRWRIDETKPVIMLPGRLTRWKGHLDLIEALVKLGRRDVLCLMVGDETKQSGYRAEVEARLAQAGLREVVGLVGASNDMPAAYMLADVVVSASARPEAFGRVAVEGQAMGRPVIATGHGGARETVLDGETGWLVPPGDTDALARALEQALSMDATRRGLMAQRAMARVEAEFSLTQMRAKTLDVYREVLAEAGRLGVASGGGGA